MNTHRELARCIADVGYFISKYCRVDNAREQNVPFYLSPAHQQFLEFINETRLVVVKKPRQSGLTSLEVMYSLSKSLFLENFRTVIVVRRHIEAERVLELAKKMHERLPDFFKEVAANVGGTSNSIIFSNGSILSVITTNTTADRTFADLLILDEAAFFDNFNETLKTTLPMISGARRSKSVCCLVGSTPHTPECDFEKLFSEDECFQSFQL